MIGARMYQIIVLRHRLFGSVNGHMGMLLDCPHGVFFSFVRIENGRIWISVVSVDRARVPHAY